MASFEGLLADAQIKLKQADHMVCVTYPLLKEPKLLLSSLNNLYTAVTLTMKAILVFERDRKTIPLFGESFVSQFEVFATRVAPAHALNKKYVQFIAQLKEFVDHHKKSSITFKRKDSYIIADDDYEMKALTSNLIKEQLSFAKVFVKEIQYIIFTEQEREIDIQHSIRK